MELPYNKELKAAGETGLALIAVYLDALITGGAGAGQVAPPLFQTALAWRNNRSQARIEATLEELKMQVGELSGELSKLTSENRGRSLFIRLLELMPDLDPADEEFMVAAQLRARMIIHVSRQSFDKLFSEMSFLLSRLEKISPQALFLLADHANWPKGLRVGGTTTSDVTLSGKWAQAFANAYCQQQSTINTSSQTTTTQIRMVTVVATELKDSGFIDLDGNKRVVLTTLGQDVSSKLLPTGETTTPASSTF